MAPCDSMNPAGWMLEKPRGKHGRMIRGTRMDMDLVVVVFFNTGKEMQDEDNPPVIKGGNGNFTSIYR